MKESLAKNFIRIIKLAKRRPPAVTLTVAWACGARGVSLALRFLLWARPLVKPVHRTVFTSLTNAFLRFYSRFRRGCLFFARDVEDAVPYPPFPLLSVEQNVERAAFDALNSSLFPLAGKP